MTRLLEKAIAEIRRLPDDRQDEVAEILLEIAAHGPGDYELSPEQLADLEERLAGPPDYATEEETAALFERLTK
jgi:hypothetical protein